MWDYAIVYLMRFYKTIFSGALFTVLVAVTFAGVIFAQTVTQGYASDEPLQRGQIIKIKRDDTTKIEAVTQETAEEMFGIIVDPNDAPVTLSNEGEKFFVASTGKYEVVVSDQNGPILAGDFITVSSLSGIGMKVDDRQPTVVGRALEGFDPATDESIASSTIKDEIGGDKVVKIGRVRADIGVSRNPHQIPKTPDLPEVLRRASETIAGKPVQAARVYLSLAIFAITTIVSGALMYSGVRSGIISIGRNPLSKKSIIRSMLQVLVTGLIIFIMGLFGVYLLLKL